MLGFDGRPLFIAWRKLGTASNTPASAMNILTNWFSRAPVKDFARSLADDIAMRYPPALEQEAGKRPSVNRLTRIVEDVCRKALEFQSEHKLGVVGKATLGNEFRWQLTSLGYQKDFVHMATEAVVVHLSRGGMPPPQDK